MTTTPKERKKKNIHRTHPVATRRVPQRTCVACQQVKAKRELVRLVRTLRGDIEVDATGKMAGRGAYICPTRECLEKTLQGKRLEHVLKGHLTPANREQLLKNGQTLLKELSG